jgi:hypothetical protein
MGGIFCLIITLVDSAVPVMAIYYLSAGELLQCDRVVNSIVFAMVRDLLLLFELPSNSGSGKNIICNT